MKQKEYKVDKPGELLQFLMEQMPDTLRTVFNMKAIDGFSFKEIAELLDKKENAVRISYMRARQWLMAELKKDI